MTRGGRLPVRTAMPACHHPATSTATGSAATGESAALRRPAVRPGNTGPVTVGCGQHPPTKTGSVAPATVGAASPGSPKNGLGCGPPRKTGAAPKEAAPVRMRMLCLMRILLFRMDVLPVRLNTGGHMSAPILPAPLPEDRKTSWQQALSAPSAGPWPASRHGEARGSFPGLRPRAQALLHSLRHCCTRAPAAPAFPCRRPGCRARSHG